MKMSKTGRPIVSSGEPRIVHLTTKTQVTTVQKYFYVLHREQFEGLKKTQRMLKRLSADLRV